MGETGCKWNGLWYNLAVQFDFRRETHELSGLGFPTHFLFLGVLIWGRQLVEKFVLSDFGVW